MTERKRRVEDLLESMGRMVVPVADESEAEREQVIDAVNNRLEMSRSTGSATRARRWLFASAAAVLCLSTGLAFAHFRRAESSVQSASAQATRAVVFKRGDAVHTDTGETRVGSLENGAQVTLGEGTEMTVSALLPGT
ncbi:MAG TPA: hypothetical protein VK745_32680, partial [Polyangiaceae bacterium]|nr:hypothetical protein [Polyangiaceae bacterium]